MKLGLPIAGVVVSLALLVVWSFRLWEAICESKPRVLAPTLIHMPPTGCPPGWLRFHDAFSDRDGTKHDGCVREGTKAGDLVIDRLDPGESVIVGIIQIPNPPPDEGKT